MTIRFDLIFLCVALTGLLAGLLFFLYPERSYACSCPPLGSPSEELAESTAVFRGKVTSVSKSNDEATYEFTVTTVWKGPLTEKRTITSREYEPACGRTFGGAEEYVVYSYNGTWDSFCSRTRPLSKAASDLEELGEGQVPTPAPPTPTPEAGGGCGISDPTGRFVCFGVDNWGCVARTRTAALRYAVIDGCGESESQNLKHYP